MIRTRRHGFYLLAIAFAVALALATTGHNTTHAENSGDAQPSDTVVTTVKTPDEADKERIVLDRPVITCADRTASKVYLQWKKVKRARRYHVYRAKEKDGKYRLIGSTSKLTYTDKTVKSKRTYYYKIYAAGRNKADKRILSKYSKRLKVVTKKKVSRTAYVGDSVMSGLHVYRIVHGKGKKVIYKVGVSTYNFYNGATMDQLLNYKPDRMYIMLGMNSLVGSPSGKHMDGIISSYKKIIRECLKENPDLQVVVLPVSPTRPSATVHNSKIRQYNGKLKKMAKDLKVYYYDYTSCLKRSDGTLKRSYSAGDGIHWTPSAYRAFKKKLDRFGKTLD
jgi:lysophospholipase L1-like esterase